MDARAEFESHREAALQEIDWLLVRLESHVDRAFRGCLVDLRLRIEALIFDADAIQCVHELKPIEGVDDGTVYADVRIREFFERAFPAGHKWHDLHEQYVSIRAEKMGEELREHLKRWDVLRRATGN